MDQGVIWSSKAHYRAVSVPKLLDVIEKPILKFSILYAMKILDVVCGRQKLKLLAIVSLKLEFQGTSRCFPRCWQSLQGSPGQLDKLVRHTSEFFLEWTTGKDLVSMVDFVNTIELMMNDEEIISNMLDEENLESEEDGDGDVDILI